MVRDSVNFEEDAKLTKKKQVMSNFKQFSERLGEGKMTLSDTHSNGENEKSRGDEMEVQSLNNGGSDNEREHTSSLHDEEKPSHFAIKVLNAHEDSVSPPDKGLAATLTPTPTPTQLNKDVHNHSLLQSLQHHLKLDTNASKDN